MGRATRRERYDAPNDREARSRGGDAVRRRSAPAPVAGHERDAASHEPRPAGAFTMGLFASSVALAVGLFAPACAMKQKAAEPASPRPGVHSSELPMGNVQEAQVAFDDAESNLKGMLGEHVTSGVEPAPPPVSPGPQPTAEPGTTPLYAGEEDRCAVACRAFGSMQRSADRLCELTGDDDDRCGDVRRRVDFARNLVHAVCPACAEAD